jgi:hypothetical protein
MLAPCAALKKEKVPVLWRRVLSAMRDGGQRVCDTRLMYRPRSGAPSWGAYYMTAPASWLVYEALCDFAYIPEEETLRLDPHAALGDEFPLVHPRFWATARRGDGGWLSVTVRRVFGGEMRARFLEVPTGARLMEVSTGLAGREEPRGCYARVEIKPFALSPGQILSWRFGRS